MGENLLSKMNSSADVQALSKECLGSLCEEIREKIIDTVAQNGGHLASNLGAVEFTVALMRVFDSARDKIVFDVGHQSYTYKLLSGRGDRFDSLRREGGIAGFPKMCEGDAFGAGHSSTSVSAALGIATALKMQKSDAFAIAVIGDGALTGGLAYEGLNNAGKSGTRLMVLLNENDMSISKNVGAFAEHLSRMASGDSYFNFKDSVKNAFKKAPLLYRAANGVKDFSKRFIEMPERNFFEDFGFTYLGPIDGHDIAAMEVAFKRAKKLASPCVVHIKTVKGRGYLPAEVSPSLYHGVSPFDKEKGVSNSSKTAFSNAFTEKLCDLAEKDERVCAITAAMTDGVGLTSFAEKFPKRCFDVGIAEGHATVFAAGLAAQGAKPVFLCYSSFLQRAYDQILHDIELQKLPVVFGIDRAGFVGADGETHNGIFDVSVFNSFENTEIYSPATFAQTEWALENAINSGKICAVRYPRGTQPTVPSELCKNENVIAFETDGADTVIITYGRLVRQALIAKESLDKKGIKAGIILLVKIKPLDAEHLRSLTQNAKSVIFAEEGIRNGGIGESLLSTFADKNYTVLAVDNPFVAHAEAERQLSMAGIDAAAIENAVSEYER